MELEVFVSKQQTPTTCQPFKRSKKTRTSSNSLPPSMRTQRSLTTLTSLFPLHWAMLHYDAMMTVDRAACEAQSEFPTPTELYQQMVRTEFDGASGYVAFKSSTETRDLEGLRFIIENVLTEQDEDGAAQITIVRAAIVNPSADNNTVEILEPFVYNDNTTTPPSSLPPLEPDQNLVGNGVIATGLVLAAAVMIMSIGWIAWVTVQRAASVRGSTFLPGHDCIGTFIMATSIIPTSFQKPMSQGALDAGCALFPWLLCLGFVTAFSALFTKNGRMNSIYANARRFRRTTIEPKDVLKPFLVLLTLNLAFLTGLTAATPWKWIRVDGEGRDPFGRPTESYCVCSSEGQTSVSKGLTIALVIVNCVPVILANYQSYKSRDLPSEFNESKYNAYSLASLLEAILIGGPVVIISYQSHSPTAYFMARAFLIFLTCTIILLFMFVPKCAKLNFGDKSTRRLTTVYDSSETAFLSRLTNATSRADTLSLNVGSDHHSVGSCMEAFKS
ncbi:Gamma-aminobutyric acid (GABA) B receptor [Seminavis robusta]|uniref:Gamma-aminobutyric acid (GABA) B receptor n=1 Tax=Seminavis robusta TaxID=568900 RepID=A0A9N8DJR0_9STRA|nr:Gamma-aminobutyric acid (GABA) B receptor [Seminavis robusta]|eukprot:Sro119_g058070.1 Gamma-aminobutyric acid (GABA) B receptor (501) ;mRNA; r:51820-53538